MRPGLPDSVFQIPKLGPGDIAYFTKGKCLGWGGTAFVEQLPSGHIIKTPKTNPYYPREEEDHRRNMRVEAEIYKKIGEHPLVPKIINWDPESCCLTMEYLENGDLRSYMYKSNNKITPELRL
jgi:tRNA A-37 threonylcarbamoyl transferase component Bud32